jgi:FtsH-binding integral membrane protein
MDIDARGPRFGAAVTTAVLAAALITQNPWVLGWQALAFAVGVAAGVPRSPYGWAFRTAVRPRLGPPKEFEPPQPPRFAQAVGLVFAALGLVGYALGPQWLGMAATAAALAAAFLNAVFGYCLGCEMYLLVRRAVVRTE